MSPRRALALLASLALLSPLAALALPACGPGQHCPMAGLMGEEAPCHGASIEADDCCVTSGAGEPAEVPPVVAATTPALDHGTATPALDSALRPATNPVASPSPPLYRLFRALLI